MVTLEERVAFLEGTMTEHSRTLDGIREGLGAFEARVDRRFEAIDRRFDAIDRRFEAIDRRFEAIDRRFDSLERRFDVFERRVDGLDDKMSRQFTWLVGLQVTTLGAIFAALLAR